jgi:hypothetical protein
VNLILRRASDSKWRRLICDLKEYLQKAMTFGICEAFPEARINFCNFCGVLNSGCLGRIKN